LVEELRSVEGIEVAVLFKELENGKIKVSLRSKGRAAVNLVARAFGGGGHEQAAGCVIPGELEEVQERVLAELARHLARKL
jgi:phosphoesterase RecJ-like protein